MKNILIFFGGNSPEHEVSVITGLQIFEHIDRSIYMPIPIFVSEKGKFYRLKDIGNRKDFTQRGRSEATFNHSEEDKSSYVVVDGEKTQIYAAVNTMHGGFGESGQVAGLFDIYNISHTSTSLESAVICMNKGFAKNEVSKLSVPTVKGISFSTLKISSDIKSVVLEVTKDLSLPVIIKPVHLGSSIGIKIAESQIELELGLLEAGHLDSEILVEKYLENISELNCSVRTLNGEVITSEIERPIPKDKILSFSEKYEKGGKKYSGGMASLSRELPAKIDENIRKKVIDYSKKVYSACHCKGLVRIDYIVSKEGEIFFNEINPIPGSMAFYLWEVMGIPFKQLLSEIIEEAKLDSVKMKHTNYIHKTEIIKNFIDKYKY